MSAKENLATMAAALLVGAMVAGPVQAAETLKLKEISRLHPISAGVNGPVDFHAMDVSPADPTVLYGHYGSVQISRDAGKTWTPFRS